MTRNYKDFTIRVNAIVHPNYNEMGYKAEFFIPKTNGTKEHLSYYETYDKGIKPMMVVEKVQRIIDVLYYKH